jgi:hypothetical protein
MRNFPSSLYMCFAALLPALVFWVAEVQGMAVNPTPDQRPAIYPTYGVHNAPHYSPCANPDCVYRRAADEPSDPHYPPYWSSRWVMYRVFNGYVGAPPPYAGRPPASLREGVDYEVSYGATYYDSRWRGPSGEGAMMEFYDKRCLPIFPINNHFTCAFISLGDTAFFVTYEQDRPKDMPAVCLFSPVNHPPRRDFIKHLPYAIGDSRRLDMMVQGYSFWVSRSGGGPVQTGVAPDRTAQGDIMFGYAFEALPRPDAADPTAAPYRHPHSFYFSGSPQANAPIVSQNYLDFAMRRPDPKLTWDQVRDLKPGDLPRCNLFNRNQ